MEFRVFSTPIFLFCAILLSTLDARRMEMEIVGLLILVGCGLVAKGIFARARKRDIAGEIKARLAKYGGRRI
jgi:hypothetical protein